MTGGENIEDAGDAIAPASSCFQRGVDAPRHTPIRRIPALLPPAAPADGKPIALAPLDRPGPMRHGRDAFSPYGDTVSISKRSLSVRAGTLLFVTGCAPVPHGAPGPVPPPASPPVATSPVPAPPPPPAPAPPAAPAAPWAGERLAGGQLPAVFVAEWRKAANRATCALIAPSSLGAGAGATPRSARFSGGWSVAYDQPGLRSAFGVAGTGSRAADRSYDDWPARRAWADGSSAGYGPEGGSGPNELAYLRIQGQDCLYNVWSRLGRAHLEQLLESLRFVAVP